MLYLVKTPWFIKKLYPTCTWEVKTNAKELYLTFDDGPQPGVTEFVLETLKVHDAKATFFCIGKNVRENRSLYSQILDEGHQVGNHTFHHLNGWNTNDDKYLRDIEEASSVIDSHLFRPPYGRITRFQLQQIQRAGFQLRPIMWTVLSGDFDKNITEKQCYLNVIRNSHPGSIIVFHDNIKSFPRLKGTLPGILSYFKEKGYCFKSLL